MNTEIEIWKDIPNYEGLYQVSNIGRIKSLSNYRIRKEKILKLKDHNGYKKITLYIKGNLKRYRVHRLVAMAFLNFDINSELVIDHIDGDRGNNKLTNLRVLTHRINVSIGFNREQKTSIYCGVCFETRSKKYKSQISIDGKRYHLGYFKTEYEAYQAYLTSLKKNTNNYESHIEIINQIGAATT